MELVTIIGVPTAAALLFAVERAAPGRRLPIDRRWIVRSLPWLVVVSAAFALGPAWLADRVRSPMVLDARIGTIAGALVACVLADAIGHLTHRLRHTVPALWRWHQLHHSAERVDLAGSTFQHPIDLAIDLAGLGAAVVALGLSPESAALAGLATWLLVLIQHLDVRTPRWLGWIVQRPEAHAIHHARGVHAYNYGKFMLWDIILGTARNPATFSSEPAGFWDGASRQLARMLAGRDVGEPPRETR